jgi:hypothetical protein
LNDIFVKKKNMKKLLSFTPVITLLFFAACSGGGTESTCKLNDVEFVLEGPLFEGPNSGNILIKNDLSSCTGTDIKPDQVRDAKLKSAVIKAVNGTNLGLFSDFKLSLMGGDDLPMTAIAQKNPIESGASQVSLDVSDEAESEEFFKSNEFILLLDAGTKSDVDDNVVLKADLEFIITSK